MIKLFDLKGNSVSEDAEYLADRLNDDGSYTVYFQTAEDIAALTTEMNKIDCSDDLKSAKYWEKETCKRMGARRCASGDCAGGVCQQTSTGNFTSCKCSSTLEP